MRRTARDLELKILQYGESAGPVVIRGHFVKGYIAALRSPGEGRVPRPWVKSAVHRNPSHGVVREWGECQECSLPRAQSPATG